MSLTAALIVIPTICYLLAAIGYATNENWPATIIYSGYCWANLGLIWLDKIMAK